MIVGRYYGDLCITFREITIIFKGEDMDIIEDNSSIIDDITIDMNSILELRIKENGSNIAISRDGLIFIRKESSDGCATNKVYYFGTKGIIQVTDYDTVRRHLVNYGFLYNKYITIKNKSNLKDCNGGDNIGHIEIKSSLIDIYDIRKI